MKMILIVLVLCWNVFITFLDKLQTVHAALGHIWRRYKFLHHQAINIPKHSFVIVSAAIAIFAGRTDNLFFCNANIYRSTGTINRRTETKNILKT